MGNDLASFIAAIKAQESRGDYGAISPDGALGAYQILASNLADWSRQALGYSVSASDFLHSPALQDKIAGYQLAKDFNAYGAAGAASAWYSGSPANVHSTAPVDGGDAPTVSSYVDQVLSRMGLGPAAAGSSPTGGGGTGAEQAGLLSIPGDIVNFFAKGYDDLVAVGAWFTRLFSPATYVRIGAGVLGSMVFILGLVFLARAASTQ